MRIVQKLAALLAIVILVVGCDYSVSLFDGKSLDEWSCDPMESTGDWRVVDGELLGDNAGQEASVIWTNREFSDFEMELEYMTLTDDYDTGLFIRGLTHQVQIGISRSLQSDMTACIYAPEDGHGSYPGQTDKVEAIHKIGEWNHLKVVVTEKRIQTFLNGEPMVDYTGIVLEAEGPLGLQLHGGVHMTVKFRNIRVREL